MALSKTRLLVALSVLVVGFGAGLAADERGLRRWVELGENTERIETENAKIKAEVERLRRRSEALRGDPRALERAARENGFVRDGEILFELKERP
jgi:cell division protein FtsB